MSIDIYIEIESLFDSIEINLDNLFSIKQNLENIRVLIKSDIKTKMKEKLNSIVNKIEVLLLIPYKDERDNEIIAECKNAKQLLYSIPSEVLLDFQNRLEKTNIDDFCIVNNDGINITLAGSFDFCYYHEVEITFHQVEFTCCPNRFNADKFTIATSNQIHELKEFTKGYENNGVIFYMENQSLNRKCFIIAHGISIKWGIVYYYNRESLKEGERIADWVKK